MVAAVEECFEGTVSFPLTDTYQELPLSLLPHIKCSPEEGICFTGLTYSKGFQVVSFGCWPRQSFESLAWYGVPECKNEVNKLLCLCSSNLCNKFLPHSKDDKEPEMEQTQALIILSIILISIILLLCGVCLIVNKLCSSGHNHSSNNNVSTIGDDDKLVAIETGPGVDNVLYHVYNPRNDGFPPPVTRMYSAPAQLLHSTLNNNVDFSFHDNYIRANPGIMIKNSLKQLETIQIPSVKKKLPRVETEV